MRSGLAICAVLAGMALPATAETAPYQNPELKLEDRVNDLLGRLTLEEKVSLLSGGTAFGTAAIPRLGVPALTFSDGPNGLRSNNGTPTTAFPVGVAMAATWNPALIAEVGKAMGQEAQALGDQVVLGPNINIQRSPLGGRNFESYAEDPVVAGKIGIGFVKGVQGTGVGVSLKHFAANNQEFHRMSGSSDVDERTLREIYLPAFEMIVKQADPWTVMASYNRLNGTFASENKWLLGDVLKGEWGYKGAVMSDWSATHSTVPAIQAGLDLEMPGPAGYFGTKLLTAIKDGQLPASDIDDHARRMLGLIVRTGSLDGKPLPKGEMNTPAHRHIAQSVAEDAIVLLKNDGGTLPLDGKRIKSIAVIGPNADKVLVGGGGSAQVTPAFQSTPLEALRKLVGDGVRVTYAQGADNEPIGPEADPRLLSPTLKRDAQGLTATYFGNTNFAGAPVVTRLDPHLFKMSFGEDLPGGGQPPFSARWQGYFWPPTDGTYEFNLTGIGAATLFLDGKPLIAPGTALKPSPILSFFPAGLQVAEATLKGGQAYAIRMEYVTAPTPPRYLRLGIRAPPGTIDDAVKLAREADAAIVFVGSSSISESEGNDRADMDLAGRQNELVDAVLAANPHTIVVLENGAPLAMPWRDRAPAIVEAWFPGQEGPAAIANVLMGRVNPSGKLPVSFPQRLEDNPAFLFYPGGRDEEYGEGIFVGYRYYEKKKIAPSFPFGHGLSYTRFDYADLRSADAITAGQPVDVSLTLKNTGDREGQEVVQLYVGEENPTETRPLKELKAFRKLRLRPGETQTVKLSLTARDFSYYDVRKHDWVCEPGTYDLLIGSSSADIRLRKAIHIAKSN